MVWSSYVCLLTVECVATYCIVAYESYFFISLFTEFLEARFSRGETNNILEIYLSK